MTADAERERVLRAISLADPADKDEVRDFVARILATAGSRALFSIHDPEIGMLRRVGSANVDVLVEPLLIVDGPETLYLTEAIKQLVVDDHKRMIIENLAAAPSLVDVVVARGWTRDATPTLLEGIRGRSPYLDADWVAAAASVARPDDYAALKFQLVHGLDPWLTWVAIRDLPGMEPLDEFIAEEWRRAGGAMYQGALPWTAASFAAVAAHYGHLDALKVVASRAPRAERFKAVFQALTGYDGDPGGASIWLEENRERLVFERVRRVYVWSPGEK